MWELLAPVGHRVSNDHVRNKVVAVDVSIWLTQFVKAMRDAEGARVRNAHLLGVLRRCIKLLFLAVKPVLIFDGSTPALKRRTLNSRRQQREKHAAKLRRLAEKLLVNQIKANTLGNAIDAHQKKSHKGSSEKKVTFSNTDEDKDSGPVSLVEGDKEKKDTNQSKDIVSSAKKESHDKAGLPDTSDNEEPKLGNEYIDEIDFALDADDESDYVGHDPVQVPTNIDDLDDDTLVGLPANVQSDLFKQIKEEHRAKHRENMMQKQHNPSEFSKSQIEGFLKHTALNRKISKVRKEINLKSGANQRIASDSKRQYVLEERDLTKPRGADFDDNESDYGSDDSPQGSANDKPKTAVVQKDLLARIRSSKQGRSMQYRRGRNPLSAPKQVGQLSSGIGWASKVLQGKGSLPLNENFNREVGASVMKEHSVDIGKNFEIDSDGELVEISEFPKEELSSSPHNESRQSKSDSDSDEWEDGDDTLGNRRTFELRFDNERTTTDPSHAINTEVQQAVNDEEKGKQIKKAENGMHETDSTKNSSNRGFIDLDSDGDDGENQVDHSISEKQQREEKADDDNVLLIEQTATNKYGEKGEKSQMERELIDLENDDTEEKPNASHPQKEIEHEKNKTSESNDQRNINLRLDKQKDPLSSKSVQHVSQHDSQENQIISGDRPRDDGQELKQKRSVASSSIKVSTKSMNPDKNKKVPKEIEKSISKEESDNEITPNLISKGTETSSKIRTNSEYEDDLQLAISESLKDVQSKLGPLHSHNTHVQYQSKQEQKPKVHPKNVPIDISEKKSQESNPQKHSAPGEIVEKHSHEIEPSSDSGEQPEVTAPIALTIRVEESSDEIEQNKQQTIDESAKNDDIVLNENEIPPDPNSLTVEEMQNLQRELEIEAQDIRKKQVSNQGAVESVSDEMYGETRDLLKLLGIPYLEAPEEAEAQCAFLNKEKVVDAVITEDSDTFLFGAATVYRRLFAEGHFAEAYEIEDIEQSLGLDRDQFIRLAYLLGSDYTIGVRGVGVVNSMEVLEAFPGPNGLKEFHEWTKSVTILDEEPDESVMKSATSEAVRRRFCWKHRNMKRNWEIRDGFGNPQVYEAYLKPVVNPSTEKFSWKKIDFPGLAKFCWEKFGWEKERFDSALGPLRKELAERAANSSQRRIDEFFKPHRFAKIRSVRLQSAVKGIAGDEAKEIMSYEPKKRKRAKAMAYGAQDLSPEEEQMLQALERAEAETTELSQAANSEKNGNSRKRKRSKK